MSGNADKTVKSLDDLLVELEQAIDDDIHQNEGGVSEAMKAVTERFEAVVDVARGLLGAANISTAAATAVRMRLRDLGVEVPDVGTAARRPPVLPWHIVRTTEAIVEDVEPHGLPSIPKGTYGIDLGDEDDYGRIDFGPPWGIQCVGNHALVDAPAVLANAKRAIEQKKRPWRNVIRRTLRTFAGPFLVVAAARLGWYGDEEAQHGGATWPVEAYLYKYGSRQNALALLSAAHDEASGKPHRWAPRTIFEAEFAAIAKEQSEELAQALYKAVGEEMFYEERFREVLAKVLGWKKGPINAAVRRAKARANTRSAIQRMVERVKTPAKRKAGRQRRA